MLLVWHLSEENMRVFVFWDRTLWHVDDVSRTLHAFEGRQVWIVFDLGVNLLQPGQMWLGGVVSSLGRNATRRPGVQSPSLGAEKHCPWKNLIIFVAIQSNNFR